MSNKWILRAEALRPQVRNFVNGHWRDIAGAPLAKESPRDGRLLCRFGAGEPREVDQAVASARQSFQDGRWSALSLEKRKALLNKLAALIEQHRDELALLETLDVGKPIRDALSFDVPAAAARIRLCAESAEHVYGRVYGADAGGLAYELHRPVGVVGAIIGWNFPLVLAVEKLAPVLAMGNSLVLKPSELTSLTASRVAELSLEAGVPEGVLNVVHGGPAVGAALAAHSDVDLITFTGSSRTGKLLMISAGQSNMKRLVLECGGKAPNIVFDDCPALDAVADAVMARTFWNQGEVCTASSRLLIHETIHDELLRLVVQKASLLRPGDPLDPETTFGALVSKGHQQKVLDYIQTGKAEGAEVAYEGDSSVPFAGGCYVAPVIFSQVSPESRIAREEIFGPVLSVMSFRDEEEAIRLANGTVYGLSAIIWTKSIGRAHRVTRSVNVGWITVNSTDRPSKSAGSAVLSIGGHKESGFGVEGGIEGLRAYTVSTAVQMCL